ncbi:MAG: DNA polymerase III subunit gamma/tau [Alphaproteobacteria bacterium]
MEDDLTNHSQEILLENGNALLAEDGTPILLYKVLARKYRPANFADLIGQEVLVRTLSNAIATGRIAHAFLLTGIRGIGKTTTARIIARGLNCIGKDGTGGATISPCGVCSNCLAIAEDRHVDVLEMDAASHTGVDDIRDLIDGVKYLPSSARYKIYIIDEVHMLSNNAFNALLKTLEEPPPHVKFIFATTESRKIPVTILSRCQRFDLKRVDVDTLTKHLSNIVAKESGQAEEDALKLISVAAEGSVRDALSMLDQAMARGELVTSASVRQMIGSADNTAIFRLLESLLSGDIAGTLDQLREYYGAGADPMTLVQDCLSATHLITRVKISPAVLSDITLSPHDREAAAKLAEKLSMPAVTRLWQMLLKGVTEVRIAPSQIAAVEMLMVRVAYAAQMPTPAEIIRDVSSSQPAASPKQNIELVTKPDATQPKQQVNNYQELVALFSKNREPLLYTRLQQEAHLVKFAVGELTIRGNEHITREVTARIADCLQSWTGEPWKVMLSKEEGEPTLYEQEQAVKQKNIQEVSGHPLVASVLEQFPGAKVVGLKQTVQGE